MALRYLALPPKALSNSKPSVLLILHGYGADEHDLLFLRDLVGPEYLTISLQAPIPLSWGGYAWYHLGQGENGLVPDDESRKESEKLLVNELAAVIEKEGGNLEDVLLAGFSQGAAMSYSILNRDLKQIGITLRGLLIMSGYIPRDIVEDFSKKQIDGLNVMITHGTHDELISHEALSEASNILESQGASVTARLYECGHGMLPETIEDIRIWIASLPKPNSPVFL